MPRSVSSPPLTRATFLNDWPARPEITELRQLFEDGNYAGLRKRALELSSADPEVVAAARELVARTRPDRMVLWLFVLSGILLALVTAFSYGRN